MSDERLRLGPIPDKAEPYTISVSGISKDTLLPWTIITGMPTPDGADRLVDAVISVLKARNTKSEGALEKYLLTNHAVPSEVMRGQADKEGLLGILQNFSAVILPGDKLAKTYSYTQEGNTIEQEAAATTPFLLCAEVHSTTWRFQGRLFRLYIVDYAKNTFTGMPDMHISSIPMKEKQAELTISRNVSEPQSAQYWNTLRALFDMKFTGLPK